jgi:ATP-dependent DNA helicase DinG
LLAEEVKQEIRDAYSRLIEAKSLSPRWGQRQMIAEIANTLANAGTAEPGIVPFCAIEAGTGTGKTIAYAVAAIPLARRQEKTLIISTATIALQEQLVQKDLPDIRRHSGLEFNFVLAKGRRRYVCLSRLDKLLASGGEDDMAMPLYPDEAGMLPVGDALPVYESMVDALGRGEWDGDRDNWNHEVSEDVWFSVTTDHHQCSGRRCPNVGQCSFFRARDALQQADIIVTNHDLVLSDLALGGGAILTAPADSIYIFDEGHHLPEKALNHFSAFCRIGSTRQWLEACEQQVGQAAAFLAEVAELPDLFLQLQPLFSELARSMALVAETVAGLEGMPTPRDASDRLHHRFAHGRVPVPLRDCAAELEQAFGGLQTRLQGLESRLEDGLDGELVGLDAADAERWFAVVGAMRSRVDSNLELWIDYAAEPESGSASDDDIPVARWVNISVSGGQVGYELRSSPIVASGILARNLWAEAAGVVATSATMTALNSFDRFILHSGMPTEASFKVVPSPFDYGNATLRVPAMDCDPGDPEAHTAALIRDLPEWLDPGEGSLVLFASRRQMLEVHEGLPQEWRERVLLQGDYNKHETLRRHRESIDEGRGSVIFGLASFAEGVDLPGVYCKHVVVAKIPFAVPDSPVESALGEWIEGQGRNSFMEIAVPDAALRLVQACGRLLRTEQDTGRVTICDRRLVIRRYGRALLEALPPFRRELE